MQCSVLSVQNTQKSIESPLLNLLKNQQIYFVSDQNLSKINRGDPIGFGIIWTPKTVPPRRERSKYVKFKFGFMKKVREKLDLISQLSPGGGPSLITRHANGGPHHLHSPNSFFLNSRISSSSEALGPGSSKLNDEALSVKNFASCSGQRRWQGGATGGSVPQGRRSTAVGSAEQRNLARC